MNNDSRPMVAIHRILCHRAQVSELATGGTVSVSVYDAIRDTSAELGELVSKRDVGPFVVRLVRMPNDGSDLWRVVETNSRNQRVALLTYDSDGDRARDDATRYAAEATEVDLTSDFDPGSHFFGERRVPRS